MLRTNTMWRLRGLFPTWTLGHLVKRDARLREAGIRSDMWYWADCELFIREGTL